MRFIVALIIAATAVILLAGSVVAQQPAPAAMWQLAPADSLLVVGFDGRPDSSSVMALTSVQDPAMRDQIAHQHAAMRKAIEDFATLFGISLDFAKDINSWTGEQWLLAMVSGDEKGGPIPVFMVASKDPAAANAALLKMLAPFERIGEVSTEPGIIAFKTSNKSVEAYASVSGPVVAFSPSKAALQKALGQAGLAVGSIAEKSLSALSGSIFYAYANPALVGAKPSELPLSGISMGVWVTDTGVKVRARGYLTEDAKGFVKQMVTPEAGIRTVNPAIPSTALVAASLPDFSALAGIGKFVGLTSAAGPAFDLLDALDQTQVSAAMTAVLPMPSGALAAMADSDQAAAEKLAKIVAALNSMGIPTKQAGGVTQIVMSSDLTLNLSQSGPYIMAATDKQSLAGVSAAVKTTGLAQSATYQETIAGLGDSNMLTLYANLAPIQGVGYLADALGVSQMSPMYAMAAKALQDVQALGVGVGFDGEAVDATVFLRGKPQIMQGIGPAMIPGVAVGAAVLFPVFARARETARISVCQSNVKELAIAALIYTNDWVGKLPSAAKWRSQLEPYTRSTSILTCPDDNAIYAFNKNLGGINLDKVQNTSDLVIFFEADPDLPNATGSRANAILPHNGRGVFGYADGHVKLESSVPDQSHWVPKFAAPKPAKKAPARPGRKK